MAAQGEQAQIKNGHLLSLFPGETKDVLQKMRNAEEREETSKQMCKQRQQQRVRKVFL